MRHGQGGPLRRAWRAWSALAVLLAGACTPADDGALRVEAGWIAEIPPVISVTAALMTLYNDGESPARLVGVTSPGAERIEMHRSVVVDDLARMTRQEVIEIPAGGRFEFSHASGYHLMLYDTAPLEKGQAVPVRLHFADGRTVDAEFTVRDRRE